MRSAHIALMLALIAIGAPASWAERLDKNSCKLLKVELAGMLALGVRKDMVRGPEWAKTNLSSKELGRIKRLIEIEEQLEFRCGLSRNRVVKISPAKGPGPKAKPEGPHKKPSKVSKSGKPGAAAEAKQAKGTNKGTKKSVEKAAEAAQSKKAKTQAKKAKTDKKPVATTQKKPRKKARKQARNYVSPQEVNPFSLSRYGTGR